MGCAPPLPLVLLGLGEVAGPPLSLSPSGNPSPTRIGGGGVLLPEGVGLLLVRHTLAGRPPSLEPLYTEAGAPLETEVDPRDHILSRVRCPLPP